MGGAGWAPAGPCSPFSWMLGGGGSRPFLPGLRDGWAWGSGKTQGNQSSRRKPSGRKVCLGSAAQTTSRQLGAQLGKVIGSTPGKLLRCRVPEAADMIWSFARSESESGSLFSSVCGRGTCKDWEYWGRRSAFTQSHAPPRASRRRLRVKSEPAASQGHHRPAASARSSVPARVPPQAAWGRESWALVAAPPPLQAGVPPPPPPPPSRAHYTLAPPPRPAPANGPLCLLVFG
ncbi:uncharacterized protein LOC144365447 [Ictidomys tridecemlineatus]